MTAWALLGLAGLFEVVWAISMKQSEGFTKPLMTTVTVVFMVISVLLLGRAAKDLPIGTAYAVWTGTGAVGVALVGMAFLGESRELTRVVCMAMIVLGVVGLKLFGQH